MSESQRDMILDWAKVLGSMTPKCQHILYGIAIGMDADVKINSPKDAKEASPGKNAS